MVLALRWQIAKIEAGRSLCHSVSQTRLKTGAGLFLAYAGRAAFVALVSAPDRAELADEPPAT